MFPQHRQAFRAQMQDGDVALFPGATLANRNNDVDFPFRQQSDFWYLSGLNEPDGLMVFSKGINGAPDDALFVLPRDKKMEIWNGVRLGPEGAIGQLGFAEAYNLADFDAWFGDLLSKAKRLWYGLGQNTILDQKVIQMLAGLRRKIRLGMEPPHILMDPRPPLALQRSIKSPAEMELMRRAAAISSEGHLLAMAQCQPGTYEYELEALIHNTFRRHGSNDSGWSYPAIVAGGNNANILHYTANDQAVKDGDLVLIDAGAEYQGYAGDITRTFPVNGKFNPAQKEMYEVVLAALKASTEIARPGYTHEDIHNKSVEVLVDGLLQMKVLSGSAAEHIESGSYKNWYMHNTGHWIGLDVHDVGRYKVDGVSVGLEPGMVMTIEPGLYIQADDETVPAELRGNGIRIEDDIHITGGDPEVLTAAAPKEVADVEAACQAERIAPPTLETPIAS
ncbi:MAG: aminopeptidase P N-terminal domain-containing protein [Planctomycetes bacterium]|nr:aminopeptidase P N-terminal domain-containing protein [Planctomycetota bacterium]